jgi:hypothetical protein
MLTNVGLWVILVAIIAIVPVGCFMTRPRKNYDTADAVRKSDAQTKKDDNAEKA